MAEIFFVEKSLAENFFAERIFAETKMVAEKAAERFCWCSRIKKKTADPGKVLGDSISWSQYFSDRIRARYRVG